MAFHRKSLVFLVKSLHLVALQIASEVGECPCEFFMHVLIFVILSLAFVEIGILLSLVRIL